MTLAEAVAALGRCGVRLEVRAGRLHVEAPAALEVEVRDALMPMASAVSAYLTSGAPSDNSDNALVVSEGNSLDTTSVFRQFRQFRQNTEESTTTAHSVGRAGAAHSSAEVSECRKKSENLSSARGFPFRHAESEVGMSEGASQPLGATEAAAVLRAGLVALDSLPAGAFAELEADPERWARFKATEAAVDVLVRAAGRLGGVSRAELEAAIAELLRAVAFQTISPKP